jgi:esterase
MPGVAVMLHSTSSGAGRPLVLLHGLFGMGNNLGSVARALQSHYRVHSVDLPNHGRSGWMDGADLPAMADCLRLWMDHQGLHSACFLGHSLGGKVAMQLALSEPARVAGLVVADIAPVVYPSHHDAVFAALDAVAAAHCRSREEASKLMAAHIAEPGVIQFLLMSLQRGGEGTYAWRFNLEGIRRDYTAVREAPVASAPYLGPTLFIRGGESDYIREEHRHEILGLFPHATLKMMPGCGHWLHVERPSLFNSIARRFLDSQTF